MATPPRPAAATAETSSLDHALFRAVFVETWRALGRYHLQADDRHEVAQRVVLVALRRWPTYRSDLGSPRQWLRGIVHNEVQAFKRGERRMVTIAAAVFDQGAAIAQHPEKHMAEQDLLQQLLAELPHEQRRVIFLHELCGFTYRQIAKREKISTTRAHARHVAGMRALREGAERWRRDHEQRGVVPLPLSIEALFAASRAPAPPSVATEAVRHAEETELAEPAESAPPASGDRRRESAPSQHAPSAPPSRRSARWLGILGFPGSAVLGGVVTAVVLSRSAASARAERPTTIPIQAPPPSMLAGPIVSMPAAEPSARDDANHGAPQPASREPPMAVTPVRTTNHDNDRLRAEQAVLDRGYVALDAKDAAHALAACAQHAGLFPKGLLTAERERLCASACKLHRRGAPMGKASPAAERRCAGR